MESIERGRLHGLVCEYRPNERHKWKRVYVIDHQYAVEGRLSNWVSFFYLNEDGTFRKTEIGDYDREDNFRNPRKVIGVMWRKKKYTKGAK